MSLAATLWTLHNIACLIWVNVPSVFRLQVGKSVDEQVQEQSQDLLDKMPQELVEEVFRAQIHKKDGQRGTNVAWYLKKLQREKLCYRRFVESSSIELVLSLYLLI